MSTEGKATEQNSGTTVIVQNGGGTGNALGIASFVLGMISIFILSPIFVPMAIILGVIAIIQKQLVWGILGLVCAAIGFMTSPILLGVFGLVSVGATQ